MDESKAFRNLNISVFLHFLGRQAYSIFVPVILLQNGYSLNLVLGFLILSSGVTIVSSYLGQRIMAGRNAIYFNILAVLSEIFLLILLIGNQVSRIVFVLMVLFEGFYYAFYYLSYFAITLHYTSKKMTGNNLGNLTITIAIASIVGPLLGSYILSGSKVKLIITAIGALFLSLVPLLRIVNTDIDSISSGKIGIKEIGSNILNYGITASFEVVVFVLWGIYAYINDFTLVSIGLIVVATSLARIGVSLFLKKKLFNKKFRDLAMLICVSGIGVTSVYRYLIPENIILTNFAMSLFYVGFQLAVQTSILNRLKGNRTYFSSMILQATTFSVRIPIYILALLIGLKSIILLPVITGLIYILLNLSDFRNLI